MFFLEAILAHGNDISTVTVPLLCFVSRSSLKVLEKTKTMSVPWPTMRLNVRFRLKCDASAEEQFDS